MSEPENHQNEHQVATPSPTQKKNSNFPNFSGKNIFHGHISAFHGHFTATHGYKFFTAIQDLKWPLFGKVALITATWEAWLANTTTAECNDRDWRFPLGRQLGVESALWAKSTATTTH